MKEFELYRILRCPRCAGELSPAKTQNQLDEISSLICSQCNIEYPVENNLFVLLIKDIVQSQMNYIEHYEKDAELFDYFEPRECAATEHEERRLREYIFSKIPTNAELILDVGSGGSWLSQKIDFDSKMLVSFDISKKNVLQSLIEKSDKNHYGIVADAMNPPIKNDAIDCIVSSEIIEHLVNPKEFVSKMMKILKPGGTFIISTPYKEVIPYYLCIHCNQMTPKNAHLHSFDEHKLSEYFINNDNGSKEKIEYFIFGNKALNILRTHVFLKFLPFSLWKIFDKIANLIINKPAHIILTYKKDNNNKQR